MAKNSVSAHAVFCFFDEIKGKLKISLEMDKIWVYN